MSDGVQSVMSIDELVERLNNNHWDDNALIGVLVTTNTGKRVIDMRFDGEWPDLDTDGHYWPHGVSFTKMLIAYSDGVSVGSIIQMFRTGGDPFHAAMEAAATDEPPPVDKDGWRMAAMHRPINVAEFCRLMYQRGAGILLIALAPGQAIRHYERHHQPHISRYNSDYIADFIFGRKPGDYR